MDFDLSKSPVRRCVKCGASIPSGSPANKCKTCDVNTVGQTVVLAIGALAVMIVVAVGLSRQPPTVPPPTIPPPASTPEQTNGWPSADELPDKKLERVPNPTADLSLSKVKWYDSDYTFGLGGSVKNDSPFTYSYIYIRYKIKDAKSKAVLSTASDALYGNLAPGETWKFKANCYEKVTVTAELDELSGHTVD